jgi:hypothetical protein
MYQLELVSFEGTVLEEKVFGNVLFLYVRFAAVMDTPDSDLHT